MSAESRHFIALLLKSYQSLCTSPMAIPIFRFAQRSADDSSVNPL
jgi:hypothetical protein